MGGNKRKECISDSVPSSEWWSPLGCGCWWWCRTWLLHHRARWCTPPRRSSRCPGRGPWFSPRPTPEQTTRELSGERNLWTLQKQQQNIVFHYRLLTSEGSTELLTSSVFYVVSLPPEEVSSTHGPAADTLSVWSRACSYRHDIIQFLCVWTSRLLSSF